MKILTLLPVLLLAVVWDFYKGKIPNLLIGAGILAGSVSLIYQRGPGEIMAHIPGVLFPVIMLFPLYKIGTIGAGDIKLFSLLGFYFTFPATVFCVFCSFWVGAVISLVVLVWRDNLRERMVYLWNYLKEYFVTGRIQYYYLNTEEKQIQKSKIHFALPIFISVLFYICTIEKTTMF